MRTFEIECRDAANAVYFQQKILGNEVEKHLNIKSF